MDFKKTENHYNMNFSQPYNFLSVDVFHSGEVVMLSFHDG